MSVLTPCIQHCTASCNQCSKAGKRRKKLRCVKDKEIKCLLFADEMIMYVKIHEEITKMLPRLISESSKVVGYKVSIPKTKSFVFIY